MMMMIQTLLRILFFLMLMEDFQNRRAKMMILNCLYLQMMLI
uniref:Uncharacterized protein n=1 Tax=Arundo donax TaxID=35708 RepID=A0A0A9FPH1_ARUDO